MSGRVGDESDRDLIPMFKRLIYTLIALAAVVLLLVMIKSNRADAASAGRHASPPVAVTTVVARPEPWSRSLNAVGSVSAVQGVTVSADLGGIVTVINFESGRAAGTGQVLVRLDTRQEQAQLKGAQARLELAADQLQRAQGLLAEGVTAQADLDVAVAGRTEAEARVGEILATIQRKTIRAPFAGILGLRQVDLGQYLSSGDPVVTLQSMDPVYVDFGVPQQEIDRLTVGTPVEAVLDGRVAIAGSITAVESLIDRATRNLQVQATFDNPDEMLRPGMFVGVLMQGGQAQETIPLPATAINYAPYGDSVFVVENIEGESGERYLGVRQQFVKLGGARGDQVGVVSGLTAGDEVVSSGAFRLRNGAAVEVSNEVQPANDPAPQPENS